MVVGDGPAALRRVRDLQRTGAAVRAVLSDTSVADAVAALGVPVERRHYRTGDLAGAVLAVLCLAGDRSEALLEARGERALVYVPDVPEECDLILTAVVRRGPLQIAFSTGGHSPAAARRLAERCEADLTDTPGRVVAAMAGARTRLKSSGTPLPPYDRWAAACDAGLDAESDPEAAVLAALGLDDSP